MDHRYIVCVTGFVEEMLGNAVKAVTVKGQIVANNDSSLGAAEPEVFPRDDDGPCQLEHCTFCDYRVCCQLSSAKKEEQHSYSSDPCFEATENPAYGLSQKNWLHVRDKENKNEEAGLEVEESMELASNDGNRKKEANTFNDFKNSNPQSKDRNTTSQQNVNCDDSKMTMKTSSATELKARLTDAPAGRLKCDSNKSTGGISWSILKHRQHSGDATNCDKGNSYMVEQPVNKTMPPQNNPESIEQQIEDISQQKKSTKERSNQHSLVKPTVDKHLTKTDLSVQRSEPKTKMASKTNHTQVERLPQKDTNPLSAMEKIKTEESIQEWLERISESTNAVSEVSEDHCKPWSLSHGTVSEENNSKSKLLSETTHFLNQALQEAFEISHNKPYSEPSYSPDYHDVEDDFTDTAGLLCNSSKASPANIPMVVMQCSRLHSHIGSKPPLQQTSLPMGTLITALYQESDWLYVQTPHGVEGFIVASNCVPIGTSNDFPQTSRRPWEPCDFPIEINVRRKCDFGTQQGTYIPAKLTTNSHKPFVNTVKMKTNFYSDRYFSHTFKTKDSIKTAKTVTDILRNSPETKVSNQ